MLDKEFGAGDVLVVAGMHRSGTSLVASWLQECGLQIGDNLIQGKYDNPLGHYEDADVVALQQGILADNGLDYLVTDEKIHVGDSHREEAIRFIRQREHLSAWGWKDPRTTLLLPFWKSLIPTLRVLAIYRHPASVVDSLLRRGRLHPGSGPRTVLDIVAESRLNQSVRSQIKQVAPWIYDVGRSVRRNVRGVAKTVSNSGANLPMVRLYSEVWCRYNREILNFARLYPDDCLILNLHELLENSEEALRLLNNRWGLTLSDQGISRVFQPGMLQEVQPHLLPLIIRLACRESRAVYDQLEHARIELSADMFGRPA